MEQGQERGPDFLDVTDQTFIEEVVEESKSRPVVVDFWADWCAPCHQLGPILEKLALEHGGAFRLARLDVDQNPAISAHFGVQGIPAVKAIVGGKLVDEFTGALPEQRVRAWLSPLLPSEADTVVAEARKEEEAGDAAGAERAYRDALATDAQNREARLGLARVLADRGARDEAREMLGPLLPGDDADRVLARIRVSEWKEIEEPGTLASAKRLAAGARWREALDGMLGALQDDPDAREAMLAVFSVLGDDDPLTREYRGKLAAALF